MSRHTPVFAALALALTAGVRFGFYAAVNQGVHKAAVAIVGADTPTLKHYWEDGPEFTGWGQVVGAIRIVRSKP